MSMEKPKCPHCNLEMNMWEVPPITFSDGLGWGVPYLFLCFNDDCSMYVEGWKNLEENFGQNASYRCINYPGTDQFECMPVFSPVGATGQVIDEQVVLEQELLKENIKKGFSVLASCYVEKDGVAVLNLLLDPVQPSRVRLKAAEMIGDIGTLDAIDPIRNHKFGSEPIQEMADKAVKKIHERHFTRDCPFCAEIIKNQAKLCKHCGKEVAGK